MVLSPTHPYGGGSWSAAPVGRRILGSGVVLRLENKWSKSHEPHGSLGPYLHRSKAFGPYGELWNDLPQRESRQRGTRGLAVARRERRNGPHLRRHSQRLHELRISSKEHPRPEIQFRGGRRRDRFGWHSLCHRGVHGSLPACPKPAGPHEFFLRHGRRADA